MPCKLEITINLVLVSEFDFPLPEELIAQQPPAERSAARMLELNRAQGQWRDTWFREFPDLLRPGDLLILNNSRVIPARLFGRHISTHADRQTPTGSIEILLTEQVSEWEWRALARPGRKVQLADQLVFECPDGALLEAEIIGRSEFGERLLRFTPVDDFFARLEKIGHIPLPPYIHRPDNNADRDRYQTVYAHQRGSVAAPTAGLHFTQEILDRIRARGVRIAFVTLHVGLGTFQPVRVMHVEDIHLHAESYGLPAKTACEINSALSEGRRVIAAGTTTVRTLEHCGLLAAGADLQPHSGSTNIFISPGFEFRVVSGLLTNFHLPQSTLLMLVSAFAGREPVLDAYHHAVSERYRFFSYGDCMFLT